ncbi:MAG: hypothetical protein HYZ53_09080 [Planctomycetes bacterium]|nr:hypothetical protein [Planctomycetota bacterium]
MALTPSRVRGRARSLGLPPRGAALVFSVSALVLLASTAVLFVGVARAGRDAAQGYVLHARARMLAAAGLERAIAELRSMELRQAWLDPRDAWSYKELYTDVELPPDRFSGFAPGRRFGQPVRRLEDAVHVSFRDPALSREGRACSGALGGTFEPAGDTYSLKVLDCAGQINLNNFDAPAAGALPAHPGNPNLFRMVDNLGAVMGAGPLGADLAACVGLRRRRGLSGALASKGEVAGALAELLSLRNPGLSPVESSRIARARWDLVRDFLTVHGWIDPSVVSFSRSGTPRWESRPRAPVDVNTCSREVLAATLIGLAASYRSADYRRMNWVDRSVPPLVPALAVRIADFLVRARLAFGEGADVGRYTFNDWMHFRIAVLDAMVGRVPGVTKAVADMLHVNANPNTCLRKLNPELVVSDPNPYAPRDQITDLDKADLAAPDWTGTTEWCWGSMGYFELESLGRVWHAGRILAEAKVSAVVKTHDLYRATTQADFEKDRYHRHPYFGSLLSAEEYPPVVSLPEYPFADGGGYRWGGEGRRAGIDPVADPFCARWDGSIQLSNLVRQTVGAQDACFGFSHGTLLPEQSASGRLSAPTWAIAVPRVQPSVSVGAPRSWRMDPTQVLVPEVLSRRPGEGFVWGRFDPEQGSDLTFDGVLCNSFRRGAPLCAWGDEFPVPEGTVEFFVKPEVDMGLWGRGAPEGGGYLQDRRTHLFEWGSTNSEATGRNQLRVFAVPGRLLAEWAMVVGGGEVKHHVLWHDIAWGAHTWHHVEVNWTAPSTQESTGPDGRKVVTAVPGRFMFFVDGNPSTPASVDLAREVRRAGPNGNLPSKAPLSHQDPWLLIGSVQAREFSMARSDFCGTIDNVFLHKWRLHERSFIPKSRYLDGSIGELVRQGLDQGEPVGIYLKRLRDVEEAATPAGGVTLGTLSCTHTHAWHIHATTGHATGKGHVSPGLLLVSGGKTEAVHAYDGCAGFAILSRASRTENMRLRKGDELYYMASFERRADLPALTTPVLDDFTVTYAAEPKLLEYVEDFGP